MPFLPIESSSDLLRHLSFSPVGSGERISYEIFRHDDDKTYFIREYHFDGRESYLGRSEIRIDADVYKVVEKTRFVKRKGKPQEVLMSLVAISEDSLTPYKRKKIRSYLIELVPILGKTKHRDFGVSIVDGTAPRKRRSISWLLEYLNRVSKKIQKPQIIMCPEIFFAHLYDDEIEVLRSYVHRTGGVSLTPLALSVFELGLAKRSLRQFASEKSGDLNET